MPRSRRSDAGGAGGTPAGLRLGHLDFLNAFPVYAGLRALARAEAGEAGPFRFRLAGRGGDPVALDRQLAAGSLHIAPVSSIALARRADLYEAAPGISISSAGPVGSVILFSRLPVEELAGLVVALPRNSATSAALVQVLARWHWGVQPRFLPWPGASDLPAMLAAADAALLIGDQALLGRFRYPGLHQVDLGEAWWAFCGEPMVFAVWAWRRGWAAAEPAAAAWAGARLREAQTVGMAALPRWLPRLARRTGLPGGVLEGYFSRCLDYGFEERHRRGLALYLSLAREAGLAEPVAASAGAGASVGEVACGG